MNVKRVGLSTLTGTTTSARSHSVRTRRVESSTLIHEQTRNPRNGLIQNLCYVVTYRKVDPAIMREAELDKLNAVHEYRQYGFKPAARERVTLSVTK